MADSKTFVARFDLLDNFSAKFEALQKKINAITGTQNSIGFDVDDSGAVQQAQDLGKKLQSSTAGITKATQVGTAAQKEASKAVAEHTSLSQRASSTLSGMKSQFDDLTGSVTKFATSLAAVAAGGAIAGLSFVNAKQSELYRNEVYDSIEANKRLHLSHEMLARSAKVLATETPGTEAEATKQLYGIMAVASKYTGTGETGLENSSAIAKYFYKNQEMLAAGGFTDVNSLIERSIMTPGKMTGKFGAAFQAATGLTDKEMRSAKSRMKAMMEKGFDVNIEAEVDKRPWDQVMGNIRVLKEAIGTAMGSTLMPFTKWLADLISRISEIPAAPGLIGFLAVATAAAGAASLLISIFAPLARAIMAVSNSTKIATLASKIYAVTQWMVAGATAALGGIFGLLTGSITLTTIATWALNGAMAVLDALNPFTYIIAGAVILAGILGYLVVKSGVLAPIWKDLMKVWKDITKGKFEKILPDIGKMIGKIDIGGIFKTVVGKGPEEALELISTGVAGLLRWVSYFVTPLISKIYDILKKMQNIFEWMYSIWQPVVKYLSGLGADIADKLKMALPSWAGGYTDEERAARAAGIKPGEKGWPGVSGKTGAPIGKSKEGFDIIPTAGGYILQDAKGNTIGVYQGDPNDVIGLGLGGISAASAVYSGAGEGGSIEATQSNPLALKSSTKEEIVKSTQQKSGSSSTADYSTLHGTPQPIKITPEIRAKLNSMDEGGRISSSGALIGHGGEEVSPARAVVGAKTSLERINEILASVGVRNGQSSAMEGSSSEIHVHNSYDFSGMKVSSDIDFETLMRKIDKRIETVSVESVKKALGQRRT